MPNNYIVNLTPTTTGVAPQPCSVIGPSTTPGGDPCNTTPASSNPVAVNTSGSAIPTNFCWHDLPLRHRETVEWTWQDQSGTWSNGTRSSSYQTRLWGIEITGYRVDLHPTAAPIHGFTAESHGSIQDAFGVETGFLVNSYYDSRTSEYQQFPNPTCVDYYPSILSGVQSIAGEQPLWSVKISSSWGGVPLMGWDFQYRLWFVSSTTQPHTQTTVYWHYDPEVDLEPDSWEDDEDELRKKYPRVNWKDVASRYLHTPRIRLRGPEDPGRARSHGRKSGAHLEKQENDR